MKMFHDFVDDPDSCGELDFKTYEMEFGDIVRMRLSTGGYIEMRMDHEDHDQLKIVPEPFEFLDVHSIGPEITIRKFGKE